MNRGSSDRKDRAWQGTRLSLTGTAAELSGGGEVGLALYTQED